MAIKILEVSLDSLIVIVLIMHIIQTVELVIVKRLLRGTEKMPFWNQVRGLTVAQQEKSLRIWKERQEKDKKLIKSRNEKPECFGDLKNNTCHYCVLQNPNCRWCEVLRK